MARSGKHIMAQFNYKIMAQGWRADDNTAGESHLM